MHYLLTQMKPVQWLKDVFQVGSGSDTVDKLKLYYQLCIETVIGFITVIQSAENKRRHRFFFVLIGQKFLNFGFFFRLTK